MVEVAGLRHGLLHMYVPLHRVLRPVPFVANRCSCVLFDECSHSSVVRGGRIGVEEGIEYSIRGDGKFGWKRLEFEGDWGFLSEFW